MDRSNRKKHMIDSVESISEEESFSKVFKNVVKCFRISRFNAMITVIISILLSPIIIKVGFSGNTIERLIDIIELSKEISISLFGIIFTGYAIFQAFATGEVIEKMLLNTGRKESMFQEYNLFFLGISLIYLGIIIINFILIVILKNIPSNYSVSFLSNGANNIIASVLIYTYFLINIYAIIEVKSFLFNIYQVFNINAMNEGIKMLKKDED